MLNFEENKHTMKHKGSISEALTERNNVITDMYRELKRTCDYSSIYAICEAISVMPADRYYISEAMAVIVWSKYRKTRNLPHNTSIYKRKLYMSLIEKCEEMLGNNPEMCYKHIIREILEEPAPCLGISPHQIFIVVKKKGMK